MINHLEHHTEIATEFSSWAASLTLAMRFCGGTPSSSFVSVIDTKRLGDSVEIFYAPDLKFLGATNYPGEYLVHGIVEGEHHRALSYRSFTDLGISRSAAPHIYDHLPNYEPPVKASVRIYRRLGEQYGFKFSLAVALAIVAQFMAKSKPSPDSANEVSQRNIIEQVMSGLQLGGRWYEDQNIMEDVVADIGTREVRLFIEYLRHFAQRHRERLASAERLRLAEIEKLEQGEPTVVQETQNDYRPSPVDSDKILRSTHNDTKVTKRKKDEASSKVVNRQANLEKHLKVNMNRYGIHVNNGRYEGGIIGGKAAVDEDADIDETREVNEKPDVEMEDL